MEYNIVLQQKNNEQSLLCKKEALIFLMMIQAKALSKSYKSNNALQALDLQINEGTIYALLGANGAGKSTTVNLFMGFIEPTAGEASINNIKVSNGGAATKPYIAYIPENVMLYQHLTGLQNLGFFSGLNGKKYSTEQLIQLLNRAGLQASAHKQNVGSYSKGMRQKVGIALALAKQAKALFLDEPTSGLDPLASNEFSSILHSLKKEGVAILMVTHDLFRAKETADVIGIMKEGRLVKEVYANTITATGLEDLYVSISKL
ncbi:MAG: ABC transporter ATP-binding protein [Sediminibacterium sp.]